MLAASDDQIYFSSKPKDKEVFLGETVQFDWDYVVGDVGEVRFGVVIEDPETKGDQNIAIYSRKKDGTTVFNNMMDQIAWIRDRVDIVPKAIRQASFKINQVKMKDSVTFFCQVFFGDDGRSEIDNVKLNVVGEYNYICKESLWLT